MIEYKIVSGDKLCGAKIEEGQFAELLRIGFFDTGTEVRRVYAGTTSFQCTLVIQDNTLRKENKHVPVL